MKILTLKEAHECLSDFVNDKLKLCCSQKILNFGDIDKAKIQIAGKNFASFDNIILKQNGFNESFKKVNHRFIDVGSIYYNDFGYTPSLNEIARLMGYDEVNHRALEDALLVANLIEEKAQKIIEQKNAPLFKPYLSCDIETTGLVDCNPYVLEIGILFRDYGFFNLDEDESELNFLIDNGELDPKRCQDIAMKMNKDILSLIEKNRK